MLNALRLRTTAVWLLLLAATLFSWESARASDGHRLATTGILVVAFIKVRLIGLEFMELRSAPLPLRLAFEAWLFLAVTVLVTLYWMSPPA